MKERLQRQNWPFGCLDCGNWDARSAVTEDLPGARLADHLISLSKSR